MDIRTDGPTLVLGGDFDVRSTWEVRNAVYAALRAHPGRDVVVDLTGVGAIDPTACKVLAAASRRARRDGHRVVLRGCGPSVRRMLHLTRLIRVVDLEREVALLR